jgi:hypothetical protein
MAMQIVTPGETRTRVQRQPNFPMAGTMKPYGLYPMMVTPVLPGETLLEFEMKRRTLSMPVRHPLVGAWLETWLVYVKLTDIDPALAEMFVSNSMPTTGYTASASSSRYFTKSGQIDWVRMCMAAIWDAYFADESELGGTRPTIDGVFMRGRKNVDWAHNLMFTPDEIDPLQLPSNPEGQLTGMQMMALAGMSEMTYEKYLAQYTVTQKEISQLQGKPEILRYMPSWTVPTNSIDPISGAPSSAWAWSDPFKAEKPMRFAEPGFLLAIQSVTPKMFSDAFDATRVGGMWGFADWFPSYNLSDPAAGIVEISADDPAFITGFGAAADGGILVDHRDLLTRGEAFVNHGWDAGPYRLPRISTQRVTAGDATPLQTLRGKYPSLDDVNQLFTESTQTTPNDARRCVYYEGIASAVIRGHVKDTTL